MNTCKGSRGDYVVNGFKHWFSLQFEGPEDFVLGNYLQT